MSFEAVLARPREGVRSGSVASARTAAELQAPNRPFGQARRDQLGVQQQATRPRHHDLRSVALDRPDDGPCDSLRRHLLGDPRHPQVGDHLGVDPTGEHPGDPDPDRPQLLSQDLGESAERGLGDRVGPVAGRRDIERPAGHPSFLTGQPGLSDTVGTRLVHPVTPRARAVGANGSGIVLNSPGWQAVVELELDGALVCRGILVRGRACHRRRAVILASVSSARARANGQSRCAKAVAVVRSCWARRCRVSVGWSRNRPMRLSAGSPAARSVIASPARPEPLRSPPDGRRSARTSAARPRSRSRGGRAAWRPPASSPSRRRGRRLPARR